MGWRRLGALGTVLGLGWGWGRCLKEEVGWKQRAPAGSGMSLAVPFLAQRLLGQVCPPEQNKGTARSASVLASGVHTHPEHYLSEPTPHSETLQPTSPERAQAARGTGATRTTASRDQICPLSRTLPDDERPSSRRGPSPRAGRPLVQGKGNTRAFPCSPTR